MDFTELTTAFTEYSTEYDSQLEVAQSEPRYEKQEIKVKIECSDYDDHVNNCARCMLYQAKKRSSILNVIIIIALAWMILRR